MISRDLGKTGVAALVVGGIVLVLALPFAAVFFASQFSKTTAETRGETSAREKTVANGNYRIANYDLFFNQCASVQTFEAQIKVLEGERDDKTNPPTAARLTVITAAISALRNQRAAAINQYNADAAKEGTAGQFRASFLPYRLDPESPVTTCAP